MVSSSGKHGCSGSGRALVVKFVVATVVEMVLVLMHPTRPMIREFKKPRRRRRRQRRLENELTFIYESRGTVTSFSLCISVKAITKLNLGHIDKSEIKI